LVPEVCFPPGECVCANREKSNLIGWRQILTPSPPNHIHFLLVRTNKLSGGKQAPNWDSGDTKKSTLTDITAFTVHIFHGHPAISARAVTFSSVEMLCAIITTNGVQLTCQTSNTST
jgi:hypothetical protein